MRRYFPYLFFLIAPFVFSFCQCEEDILPQERTPSGTQPVAASPQTTGGSADKGWQFLRYGNFIGGGIPYDLYLSVTGGDPANLLQREGDAALLPPDFNVFTTARGAKIVGGVTCLGCHAGTVGEQFIPGLGNSLRDFTTDNTAFFTLLEFAVRARYDTASAEWAAFEPFARGAKAAAPYTRLPFRGINPAFMLEEASVARRNPVDLHWLDTPYFPVPTATVGSDVPPLWHVKKKNALYYNGMGRGDFTKLLMQVAVVAVEDTVLAREINTNFKDVMAWLQELEPPAYPRTIDATAAARGKTVFAENCQSCHGTYGTDETYPNLLVDLDRVGTDPVYARYFVDNPAFSAWFNASWYGTSRPQASAQPSLGYIAPPLDGIWATAPYLHNGSVPTLAALLDSSQRPTFWRRSYNAADYDYAQVGWQYTVETSAKDAQTYNTTLPGYGNQGHIFGDVLTASQRKDLIEYLKTL